MYNTKYKQRKLGILTIVISVAALASCQSYKHLGVSPPADTDSIFRDVVSNSDTTTIADIPWREYFTDPKLQTLIIRRA